MTTPVLILNAAVLTAEGTYRFERTTAATAAAAVAEFGLDSAVGHESTAEILSQLLRAEVPACRKQAVQAVGQTAVVFRLAGRPTSFDMSLEEVEAIGYDLYFLERIA